MKMCPIASGSSGNVIYVGSSTTNILVDAGISKKRIEEGLQSIGMNGFDMNAILITHEHSDHIQGLGVFVRKYPVPIYGTARTLDAIQLSKSLGHIPPELFHVVEPDVEFEIGDVTVHPMKTSHDAADSVAYRFYHDDKRVAIATDLGTYDEYIVNGLKELDAILIEANHDVRMLQVGPYPYPLKQRILSDVGHLSNELCGKLLCEIAGDRLRSVILGHLSQENNLPDLAYETVRMEIEMSDNELRASDFDIRVAKRSEPSGIINV